MVVMGITVGIPTTITIIKKKSNLMSRKLILCLAALFIPLHSAFAGPVVFHDRKELEAIMEDLIAWWPGTWDSFPQIYYERTVTMPKDGEHEHWHRTFAKINAPQLGEVVFYGQINVEGRDGAILGRSQALYKVSIDEARGVVSMSGQPIADPDNFENLHERPELWGKVRMMDESAIMCDFVWRREGDQLVGVVDSKVPERRKNGPGTCSYLSPRTNEEFMSDAEWVLTPEKLWLYDINTMAGMIFIGREDRTHTKLYRARPYACEVQDAQGKRTINAHDRGYEAELTAKSGRKAELLLLRADYPAADGFGLDDRLRLMLVDSASKKPIATTDLPPLSKSIKASAEGVNIECKFTDKFASLARANP